MAPSASAANMLPPALNAWLVPICRSMRSRPTSPSATAARHGGKIAPATPMSACAAVTTGRLVNQTGRQTRRGDHDDAHDQQRAFLPQPVDERTGRGLRDDLREVARRERRADLRRVPAHGGLQEKRDVRPHAVLHVGDAEVERHQRAHAAAFLVGVGEFGGVFGLLHECRGYLENVHTSGSGSGASAPGARVSDPQQGGSPCADPTKSRSGSETRAPGAEVPDAGNAPTYAGAVPSLTVVVSEEGAAWRAVVSG